MMDLLFHSKCEQVKYFDDHQHIDFLKIKKRIIFSFHSIINPTFYPLFIKVPFLH